MQYHAAPVFKLFLLPQATGQEKVFIVRQDLGLVMAGKLIVIEGTDSSGKATQTGLLVERLRKEGHDVKTLDFPQYESFFGSHVAKYLRGEYGRLDSVHPELASMLFAFDRFGQKEKLRKWLDDGSVVILNRYMESNMGHQAAKIADKGERLRFLEWLNELEVTQLGIPRSDLVLYLNVPANVSRKIIKNRTKKWYLNDMGKDIHEKNRAFQERSVQVYGELCGHFAHWHKINCTSGGKLLSREAIHERVWKIVRKEL